MKRTINLGILLSIILLGSFSCNNKKTSAKDTNINAESVYMLLDLMETLIQKNPDYKQVIARMDSLSSQERKEITDNLMRKNNDDPGISQKINSLLESSAYKLYYSQFKNIKPATHRMILSALPYAWIPSPGGVSRTLYEVCLNLDKIKPWVDKIIPEINLKKSHNLALEWLPNGEYDIPQVYFIIDGNGDAFARNGKVCFDIYSILIRELPQFNKYDMLQTISVANAENVLAHELFHIYALPYLNVKDSPINLDWKTKWKDRITKRMVTEGIAMQCNPLSDFKKEIFEDSMVIKYWIGQLNSVIEAMNSNKINEDEFKKWLSDTYFADARNLLSEYLNKDFQNDELEQKVNEHIIDRPSMIYTIGWWIITNILKTENGKTKVIDIVSDYKKVFTEYNNSLPKNSDDLIIRFQ